MIIDTTVSFHERRICMAQALYAAISRKRAKKRSRRRKHEYLQIDSGDHVISIWKEGTSDNREAEILQRNFTRLLNSIERFSIYLKKARANCDNQTVVVLSG